MLRSISVCCLTVSAIALMAGAAQAQNYVRSENFNGPNVIIDFGTLNQANSAPNQWAVAPIVQQNIPAPAPPLQLRAPMPKQQMAMTPLAPAPVTGSTQPPMVPDNASLLPDVPAPRAPLPSPARMQQAGIQPAQAAVMPPVAMPSPPASAVAKPAALPAPSTTASRTALASITDTASPSPDDRPVTDTPPSVRPSSAVPAPTNFAARDMMDMAPPAPAMSASMPKPAAPPSVTADATPPVRNTRDMLANARSQSATASDSRDRVNLASISSGPPLPIRSNAVAQPVAPVTRAAPAKLAALVKSAPPVAAPKASRSNLLSDSTENTPMEDSALDDVVKPIQATRTPMPKADAKPTQVASLPPAAKLPDLDTEDRPASASVTPSKAKTSSALPAAVRAPTDSDNAPFATDAPVVSIGFDATNGALDDTAKKDLDNVIKNLKKDKAARAQIRAYASGTPETSGQARRLSLTRALAARAYLMDQDIAATRLDIRALGNGQGALGGMEKPTSGVSMDRVDVSVIK